MIINVGVYLGVLHVSQFNFYCLCFLNFVNASSSSEIQSLLGKSSLQEWYESQFVGGFEENGFRIDFQQNMDWNNSHVFIIFKDQY